MKHYCAIPVAVVRLLWSAAVHYRFEDIDLSVRLETVKMCSSFFQHQPALIDDVSGKRRRKGAAGTGECKR